MDLFGDDKLLHLLFNHLSLTISYIHYYYFSSLFCQNDVTKTFSVCINYPESNHIKTKKADPVEEILTQTRLHETTRSRDL